MKTIQLPPNLTRDQILDAAEASTFDLESLGFCLHCGLEHSGLEPDARRRHCDQCGHNSVYGAEELLIMIGL